MVLSVPPATPIHLRPAAEAAHRVLLPGDPHRALALARALLEAPRMFNHHRGLWGYTGQAPDGLPLTIQATGIGGPSAAIVVEELVDLGARLLVRVGTCGSLVSQLRMGDLIVATAVIVGDGASAALGAEGRLEPHPRVRDALVEAGRRHGARPATVVSTDLFYDDRAGLGRRWVAEGAEAVEMEAATVLRVAERRGVEAGCVLAVTDLLALGSAGGRARRARIESERLEAVGILAGELALRALTRLGERGGRGDGRR